MDISADLTQQLVPHIIREVRVLFPQLARAMLSKELDRCRAEERLAQAIYTTCAPRMMEIAWEMTQQQVRTQLPTIAREMIQQELEQLRTEL